jgi:hypothetical protein
MLDILMNIRMRYQLTSWCVDWSSVRLFCHSRLIKVHDTHHRSFFSILVVAWILDLWLSWRPQSPKKTEAFDSSS